MRIHVIYTGGTIGMVDSPRGLVPGADLAAWLARLVAALRLDAEVTLESLEPLIDSSNATPASWQRIIDEVRSTPADAYVVLHGTDTLAYTASALSYALAGIGLPVILTGSQLPLGHAGSDASANVAGALGAAQSLRARGVCLFFGGQLLAGNRATKVSSWAFEGFASPSAPPLATAGREPRVAAEGAPLTPPSLEPAPASLEPAPAASGSLAGLHWDDAATDAFNQAAGTSFVNQSADTSVVNQSAETSFVNQLAGTPLPYSRQDVVVLDMVPGISAARIETALTPRPDAALIRAFGVGNVPSEEPGLIQTIGRVIADGVPVVVASQCLQADVALGHYEAGDALARAGAVGTGDMTLEAAYAKIVFLLSQGVRGKELSERLGQSISGEISAVGESLPKA